MHISHIINIIIKVPMYLDRKKIMSLNMQNSVPEHLEFISRLYIPLMFIWHTAVLRILVVREQGTDSSTALLFHG